MKGGGGGVERHGRAFTVNVYKYFSRHAINALLLAAYTNIYCSTFLYVRHLASRVPLTIHSAENKKENVLILQPA